MASITKKIIFTVLCILTLFSCKTPTEITYFQDASMKEVIVNEVGAKPLRILPGDVLNIVVHSRDPQLAALFNLSIQGHRIGQESSNVGTSSQSTTPYTVDSEGNIDFPILGEIHVQGLTRDELAQRIKNMLIAGNHCNDAVITIDLSNVYINVLGEVARPGRYSLTKDRITVLDALGMAGDLTIQGKREDVIVLRHEGNSTHTFHLNLLSIQQVAASPAYYLQQDDVVYVEPNDFRKRQTTVNGNNTLSASFWISVASFLMTVANFISK